MIKGSKSKRYNKTTKERADASRLLLIEIVCLRNREPNLNKNLFTPLKKPDCDSSVDLLIILLLVLSIQLFMLSTFSNGIMKHITVKIITIICFDLIVSDFNSLIYTVIEKR